jgi:zinc protease
VEIGVVGDFDVDAAIAAAASTFGAIPARPAQRPEYADLRAVGRTTEKSTTLTFASKLPKAAALVVWPTTDRRSNITRSRHSNLLASILGDLVEDEVREKLGESYSPDVHSLMSDTFTGDGAITAILLCKGELAAELSKIVKEIAAKLAVTGATQDQLERARGPLLKMLEEQKRNNIWWLNTIISQAQSSPQRIEWARTLADEYSKASLDDINKLAKEYLTSDRAIDIEIIPEGTKQAAIPAPSATGAKKENGNGKEKEKTKEKPKAGAAAGAK